MKRIAVISDLQTPHHDRKAVTAVTSFLKDYQPDQLLIVGDEADQPEPSRWNKGLAGEHAGTLQSGLDEARALLAGFREAVGDIPITLQRSNHGDRIRTYIRRFAPALDSLRALEYERLIGLSDLAIHYSRTAYQFAPGWVMMHGDEGSLSRQAGGTALGLARLTGRSTVCGHTHRLGLVHDHDSINGKLTRSLFGFEVGHLCDLKQMDYLRAGAANWQSGFGVITVHKNRVLPTPVPIINGHFTVEGQVYEC